MWNALLSNQSLQIRLMQSEHLGHLSRGVLAHDIDLYRLCVFVSSTILRKTADLQAIFAALSADFRVICERRKAKSNPRRRNLAVFPIHVRGFVYGRRDWNNHSLSLPDFLNSRISANGNQGEHSGSAETTFVFPVTVTGMHQNALPVTGAEVSGRCIGSSSRRQKLGT